MGRRRTALEYASVFLFYFPCFFLFFRAKRSLDRESGNGARVNINMRSIVEKLFERKGEREALFIIARVFFR